MSRPVRSSVHLEEPAFGRRLDGWAAPGLWSVLMAIGMLLPAGCKENVRGTETVDFARLYVQLRIASSGMEGQPEKAREARDEVLRRNKTNLVGYRKRLRELQSDPDHWELFWDRVQILADSIENKKKKKGS